jgi:hypothetical protein
MGSYYKRSNVHHLQQADCHQPTLHHIITSTLCSKAAQKGKHNKCKTRHDAFISPSYWNESHKCKTAKPTNDKAQMEVLSLHLQEFVNTYMNMRKLNEHIE